MFAELRSDIPLICVCGNHDVGNIPTKESVEEYRRNFGDDFFSFWVGGVKFIVINTQYYENSTKVSFLFQIISFINYKPSCRRIVVSVYLPWFV